MMRSKLYVIGLMCLALILSACGMNGTSTQGTSGGSSDGTLPNGSNVAISTSSIILDASESTAAGTLSISGGSANATYTFVFADSSVTPASLTSKARTNSTDSNGISVTTTPSPCTLGTVGTGLPTSCSFNVSASPSTPAGKYTIAITAQGSDGSATILNPLTVIVNGSTLSDTKAITSFAINNVDARIIGQNITLTLPFGTSPTALIATYVTTGESVSVNSVLQDDGVTPNDFTNPVEYVVHAADGTTATYTVTVSIVPGQIIITTPGFSTGGSIIQGGAFTVVATLSGSNVTAQTIIVANSLPLSNAGISVTSDPSPCTLSTPSNMTCTFTIYADWNLATTGNYTLQLSNSGSITPDQTSIAFNVYSPAIYLPKTGESAAFGWPLLTMPTGADGNPAIGLSWPSTRFVVGTGGETDCITDTLTGLMWAKNAYLQSSLPDWAGALTYTDSLSLCGYSDWRLPNINELQSLVNDGYTGADADATTQVNWLQSQGFTGVQRYYWSSSTFAKDTTIAWYVGMTDGRISNVGKTFTGNFAVWPVRSGQ